MTRNSFIILVLALFGSCKNDRYHYKKEASPGLLISFDDNCVDQWFELRDIFTKHHARVTFFVTRFDSLTDEQIKMLRVLQQDGHEIGFHGAMHVISEHYIKENDMKTYLKNEIVAGINSMNRAGFYPTSFAYPYSAKYWWTDQEILKYFYVVRSTLPIKPIKKITSMSDVFYSFDGSRLIYTIPIDRSSGLSLASVEEAMQRACAKKEVLMLHGHEPKLNFDVAFLEQILDLADKHKLNYYRASDLIK